MSRLRKAGVVRSGERSVGSDAPSSTERAVVGHRAEVHDLQGGNQKAARGDRGQCEVGRFGSQGQRDGGRGVWETWTTGDRGRGATREEAKGAKNATQFGWQVVPARLRAPSTNPSIGGGKAAYASSGPIGGEWCEATKLSRASASAAGVAGGANLEARGTCSKRPARERGVSQTRNR